MARPTDLQVTHDQLECAVCARTLLTGERAEHLVRPSGEEVIVCELCAAGARAAGWERGTDNHRPPRSPAVVTGTP